jgi:hypothetical protein
VVGEAAQKFGGGDGVGVKMADPVGGLLLGGQFEDSHRWGQTSRRRVGVGGDVARNGAS